MFLVIENRRPQATLAWMFASIFLPGVGLAVYLLFGRNRKAFAKQRKLLMQDLEANAKPLLASLFARQESQPAVLTGVRTELIAMGGLAPGTGSLSAYEL